MHYAEAVFGVPYYYNKLLDVLVYHNGEQLKKTFCANVRYLNLNVEYDIDKLNQIFRNNYKENETEVLGMNCSLVSANDTVTTYLELCDSWSAPECNALGFL